MTTRRCRLDFLVVCLALLSAGFHATDRASAASTSAELSAQTYRAACADVEKHRASNFWIDDTPEGVKAVNDVWAAAGATVVDELNTLHDVGVAEVDSALHRLAGQTANNDSDVLGAVALPGDSFLAALPSCFDGTVVIIGRADGHYRVVWSTARADAAGVAGASLKAWHPDHARESWPRDVATRGRAGPLSANFLAQLPNDARGHTRFAINAGYAQAAGGTQGAQVSVWRWDGSNAQALVVRDYAYMVGQPVGIRVEGPLLKVRQKKSFRTMFDCGGCEGRQVDWTLRLTPRGVEDLGEISWVPELDAIDELFWRMIQRKATNDIASEAAVATARNMVDAVRRTRSAKDWADFPNLGMLALLPQDDRPVGAAVFRFGIYDLGIYDVRFRRSKSRLYLESLRMVEGGP